jgi:GNAT superfamily N-acetyltransferase
MEYSKDFEKDWSLTYKMYSTGLLKSPMINFWEQDKSHTQTTFFKFGFLCHTIDTETTDIPYIKILYILEEYRNKKIGKNLIAQFLNECKKRGFKFVKVEPTFESLSFWKSLGFVEIKNDFYNQFIIKL